MSPYHASSLTLLELHFVLGQGSGFVAENEFYLAELFNQVRCAAVSVAHVLSEKHPYVLVDYLSLQNLQQLNKHVKRNGNHVGVCYPVGKELDHKSERVVIDSAF